MVVKLVRRTVEKFLSLGFVKTYLGDVNVRNNIYLLRSLISGVMYSAFNMLAAIYYNSRWFFAVAIYYILLVTTRYILYLTSKRHVYDDSVSLELYHNCRAVGIVMLFLNVAMATMIVYTTVTLRAQNHSLLLTCFLGVYSVSIFIFNIASVLYNRRRRVAYSYIIARIISFCASFMSLFNFVNSLVFRLEIKEGTAKLINAAVGAAVIFSVLILCIAVIYKCNRKILLYNARIR